MAVVQLAVSTRARSVYIFGTARLSNFTEEYQAAIKQYAADTFYIDDIDRGLANGWITDAEHAETLALKAPEDPQYRIIA